MATRKRTRREEDKEKRREEIISTALRLFAQRGIEQVSFTDIARATRLSRPLIYFYFPDLQTLVLTAVLETSRAIHARFLEAVRQAGTGQERIEAIGRAYVAYHREHPDAFAIFSAHEARAATRHPLEEAIGEVKKNLMDLTADALRLGRRDGSIRRDIPDPAVLSFCLWSFAHGLAQVAATKSDTLSSFKIDPDDLVEQGFRFIRSAFVKR